MRTDVIYGLAVDLVAITILAHLIYFYRHYRRDLRLAYVSVNVGVFTVVTLLLVQRADLAIGFGLFGVLSIIRLRSSALTQEEVGYYFVSLALGLVNGLAAQAPWLALPLDALLLTVMYAADHPRLPPRAEHRVVTLDVVHPNEVALAADLENRLGGTLLRHSVIEADYVRDITVVDVRFRPSAGQRAPVRVPGARAASEGPFSRSAT